MEENPVNKLKEVTVSHANKINTFLIEELGPILPYTKLAYICNEISNELMKTSIDVGNIYIEHENRLINEFSDILIQKLK